MPILFGTEYSQKEACLVISSCLFSPFSVSFETSVVKEGTLGMI